jgi:peroxiredoxin
MHTSESSDRNHRSISGKGSRRLEDLETRFRGLEEHIEQSPVKQALSVLHGMVQEIGRGQRKGDGGTAHSSSLEDIANLYRRAPAMEAPAVTKGLAVGTRAPDFALPMASGQSLRLEALLETPVVVAFYPLDWSPGCSQQLDLYQDERSEFAKRGAQLIGISVDSIYSHGAWAAVRGLEMPLLSDFHPKGGVARAYQVYREDDGFSDRALFLIDTSGEIRYAHVSPYIHHVPDIEELLQAIDALASARVPVEA